MTDTGTQALASTTRQSVKFFRNPSFQWYILPVGGGRDGETRRVSKFYDGLFCNERSADIFVEELYMSQ